MGSAAACTPHLTDRQAFRLTVGTWRRFSVGEDTGRLDGPHRWRVAVGLDLDSWTWSTADRAGPEIAPAAAANMREKLRRSAVWPDHPVPLGELLEVEGAAVSLERADRVGGAAVLF